MEQKECKFCGHSQKNDDWTNQIRFTQENDTGKFIYSRTDEAVFTQCPECFNFIDLEYDILIPENGANSK